MIITKTYVETSSSSRAEGNKNNDSKEFEEDLKEIVKLKQSGMTVTQRFVDQLEETMEQDIFRKTMYELSNYLFSLLIQL